MVVAQDYDALLLDLDGTIWEGGRAIPGAVEGVIASGLPAMYVTNNASRAPEAVAEQLRSIGLPAKDSDVLTSAQAAIEMVSDRIPAGSKVFVLGSPSFRALAEQAGFVVVDSADDAPIAVLQGHSPETGWAQLSEAALAIQRGAVYVASNLDTTLPQERGLMIGNGSMVAAVVSATGVVPDSAGKPGPPMFLSAAAKLGSSRPLAVGDRLNTDIAGGNAAGMDTFQVLTGVSGYHAVLRAIPEERPTMFADSMGALLDDAAELIPAAQGGFQARLEGSTLVLSGGTSESTPIQSLRTAAAVAWDTDTSVQDVRAEGEHATRVLEQWS